MKKKVMLLQFALLLMFSGCLTTSKEVMAAGTAGDVVGIAASQVGYHEKATNANLDDMTANSGSGNFTKYARDIGVTNGQAWCATFVWWCMQSAGVPADKYPRVTYATRDWFRSRGLWHDRGTYTPKVGDYVAFGSQPDHCGIVESVSNGVVNTIEGNSSDQVIRRSYSLSNTYIMGYGEIQYSGSSSGGATANTSNPGYPYSIPSGNIGQGNSGDGTRWIQTALNNLIGAGLAVDGIFGAATKNAVIQFQSANGLAADGVVGNDTRTKMIAVWQAKQDTVKPVISNIKVSSKYSTGYIVECDVSDNVGVTKVQFPTWTINNNQDDLKWVDAAVSNGHAKVTVNISDHNYETGPYITHIYAWDAAGNQTSADAGVIYLPKVTDGTLQNPGESFVAQITTSGSKALIQSGDKITAAGLEKGNVAQQWKFTRNSDGTYFIINLANNKYMDVYAGSDADGAIIWTYQYNGSDAQKWYIYKNKSGAYYFVPKVSKYRVMDSASSSGQMHLWVFHGDANAAQLFGLSMVTESTPTPVDTNSPSYTETPGNTDQPSVSDIPDDIETTNPPTATRTPSPTKDPNATVNPSSTKNPEEIDTEDDDIGEPDDSDMDDEDDDVQVSKKSLQVRSYSLTNKKNRSVVVRWKKVSGASGYQIQYALNKGFVRQCKTKNIAPGNTKFTVKGLKKGKKYYVRIRAYSLSNGKKIVGKWSKVKTIKIKK